MAAPRIRTDTEGVFQRGTRYVATWRDARGASRSKALPTKAAAVVYRAERLEEARRGDHRPTPRLTFTAYLEEWKSTFRGRTSRGIRAETRADYVRDLYAHAVPYFGRMLLSNVEPRDIRGFVSAMEREINPRTGRPLAGSTVRNRLAAVKAVFGTAFEDGLIQRNPTMGLRFSFAAALDDEDDEEPARALGEGDLARLLGATPEHGRLLMEFIAYTGVRVSEAIAIRWRHVDFDAGHVIIRRRRYRGREDRPKSRYGRRSIPLPATLVAGLRNQRVATRFNGAGDLVFCTQTGTAHDYSNLWNRVLDPARRAAGLEWVSGFHALRHTYASRLFRHGWNIKQVQRVLGHHSPAFTLEKYVHLLPDDIPSTDFLVVSAEGGDGVATSQPETDRDASVPISAGIGK